MKKKSREKSGLKAKKEKDILIGIVDDNAQVALSIAQLLEYNGFKTYQAYNGFDAVELTKQKKPKLLVLDIRMEGMSGYDVAKALPEQKILFMTGFDIEKDKISQFKNIIGVMQKPVDINQLLERVKSFLKS